MILCQTIFFTSLVLVEPLVEPVVQTYFDCSKHRFFTYLLKMKIKLFLDN